MIRKLTLIFFSLFLLLTFWNCGNSDTQKIESKKSQHPELNNRNKPLMDIDGTYHFGTDTESGPVGSVIIYQLNDSTALFYLDICRGAPSYNLGQMLGELSIEGKKGIYNGDCSLLFEFHDDQLKIQTDDKNSECGFGHAVYADNIYKLIDRTKPKFFIDGHGDTTYFDGLKVTKYYSFE